MITHIYVWNQYSEGADNLAAALKIKKIKHEGSAFKGSRSKTVINWGSGQLPGEVLKSNILNEPDAVKICSNKLSFFNKVAGTGVSIPDFTTDHETAMGWIRKGSIVCARKVLNGHSAKGLIIMEPDNPSSFTKAPLYTKYIKKEDEYRVHVLRDRVIDVQRKALRPGYIKENPNPNYRVRNLDNGFIFVRGDVQPPKSVLDNAIAAVRAVGLDFGAVDVVFNEHRQTAYVLEINTAPGITGTTVDNYKEAFRKV